MASRSTASPEPVDRSEDVERVADGDIATDTGDDGLSGRERTVQALVHSATELFATRGPASVSLREIAAHAGVNFGLIHQYIGTKDDLLRLAFRKASENAAARYSSAGDMSSAVDQLVRPTAMPSLYVRMLAWALLEGREPTELLGHSPALASLQSLLPAAEQGDGGVDDARVRIAAVTSLALGWSLFNGFVRSAVDLDDVAADDVARSVNALAKRLLVLHD